MEYYIYGLYSTEDNKIRYVGQTKSPLSQRKNEHKCDALTKKIKNHKCNWIRNVYKNGYELGIILIEKTDEKHWAEKEVYWISTLKKENKLVNELDGGNCGGIGGKLQNYLSYDEAKKFIQKYIPQAKSETLYRNEYKKNIQLCSGVIPATPYDVYSLRGEWISWGDFLGTKKVSDNIKHSRYFSYSELQRIIIDHNIQSHKEYSKLQENNERMPLNPSKAYKNSGWQGWAVFLNKEKKELTYTEFCEYMRHNAPKMTTINQYYTFFKRNKDKNIGLVYHPDRKYKIPWKKIFQDIG